MKTCSKCGIEKDLGEFYLDKKRSHGRASWCKDCVRCNAKKWAHGNREKNIAKATEWNRANPDRRGTILQRYKVEHRDDIQHRLRRTLRFRLRGALNGRVKVGSAVKDLGCTVSELKAYLEAQFQPGMTWENRALTGWHVDHIRPLASFDLTDREQLLRACHYTNLQPLWAKENLSKHASLTWKQAA